MKHGTIKWYNEYKGYGFITPTDGTPDVFVHFSAIEDPEPSGFRTLREGEAVEYDDVSGPTGPQATTIRRRTNP